MERNGGEEKVEEHKNKENEKEGKTKQIKKKTVEEDKNTQIR